MVGVAVVLVQVLVATAPGLLNRAGTTVPSHGLVTGIASGLVATTVTLEPDLLTGAAGSSSDVVGSGGAGTLAAVVPAVAVAVFVALVMQMARADGRQHLVESAAHAVTVAVLASFAVGWIGAAQSVGGSAVVWVGAAGLAAGLVVWALPGDRWLLVGAATVVGALGGAAVIVGLDTNLTWFFGVVVGSASALLAVVGQVAGRSWSRGRDGAAARWGFPGAIAVALAGPVVHIGGQLITVPGIQG
ncbi:MAG: hypothetical protein JWP31_2241 [Aeromicrobium sp.]|nr:hypothetical protein [Aeromicrobium sp.]